jgi:hypothetical protein
LRDFEKTDYRRQLFEIKNGFNFQSIALQSGAMKRFGFCIAAAFVLTSIAYVQLAPDVDLEFCSSTHSSLSSSDTSLYAAAKASIHPDLAVMPCAEMPPHFSAVNAPAPGVAVLRSLEIDLHRSNPGRAPPSFA